MKVENAIILAAGTSSRFAPLSYEKHKGLTEVKGEILVERQIEQLKDAGVPEIYIVTGYKAEQFEYLPEKYGVKLIYNPEYLTRNNNGSIWAARDVLGSSYICSADDYFTMNPFESEVDETYYAALFTPGHTEEWCMTEDRDGYIDSVTIGGENAWYMFGHVFWSAEFSERFLQILEKEYDAQETKGKLWEKIFMAHLDELKMRIKKYSPGTIYEFDTLEELREFDESYQKDTRSPILKKAAKAVGVGEEEIAHICPLKGEDSKALGFSFAVGAGRYRYFYETGELREIPN